MKLNKALKQKWLRALRSGRYKQAPNALKKDGAYCCLGVLANVAGCKWKAGPDGGLQPILKGKSIGSGEDKEMYLRPDFCGIRRRKQDKLANMNDEGKSFREIADAIERTL